MENNYAIEMRHITKSFPGIKANDDISLDLKYGEIHALLGENGAGKSTIIKSIVGIHGFEEGYINACGYDVVENPLKTKEASRLGGQGKKRETLVKKINLYNCSFSLVIKNYTVHF